MSDKVNRRAGPLFARLEADCPDGHSILIARASRLSDLLPGDVITGTYRPSTGRQGTRVQGGISFARYVPKETT